MSKANRVLAFILCHIFGRDTVHLLTINFPDKRGICIPDGIVRPDEDTTQALFRVIATQTGLDKNNFQLLRDMGRSYRYSLFADQHTTYNSYLLELEARDTQDWSHKLDEYSNLITVSVHLRTSDQLSDINSLYRQMMTPDSIPELFA